jgi:CYTH domain-containing protein
MANEIERKFLVVGNEWKGLAAGAPYRQGYLSTVKERTVRVRTIGPRGMLTVKGLTRGVTRLEFEYDIPAADANRMLDDLCERPLIEKVRYTLHAGAITWQIDEFTGENRGLVVAEVELSAADQAFDRPPWLGDEVSSDPRYFNANLVRHPYRSWSRA